MSAHHAGVQDLAAKQVLLQSAQRGESAKGESSERQGLAKPSGHLEWGTLGLLHTSHGLLHTSHGEKGENKGGFPIISPD